MNEERNTKIAHCKPNSNNIIVGPEEIQNNTQINNNNNKYKMAEKNCVTYCLLVRQGQWYCIAHKTLTVYRQPCKYAPIHLPLVTWPFSISTSLLKSLLFAAFIWLFNWTSSWLLFLIGSVTFSTLFGELKLLENCNTIFGIIFGANEKNRMYCANDLLDVVGIVIYCTVSDDGRIAILWAILIRFGWLNDGCLHWISYDAGWAILRKVKQTKGFEVFLHIRLTCYFRRTILTSKSDPLTISTNCLHLSINIRLWLFSRRPG